MRPVMLSAVLASLLTAVPVEAVVSPGDPAPAFVKNELDAPPPADRSLSSYPGKVVIFSLFGHNCPFCVADGPSVQNDLWQYYESLHPGQVQVLGADMYNGTAAQVRSFRTQTGATYPLLLQGSSETGGNLSTLYGPFDNYVVIDQMGVVRYHASIIWPHGNRYHPDEIRAVVDDLLTTSGVPDGQAPGLPGFLVQASPNPFRSSTQITITNPLPVPVPARVSVVDFSGRVVATLRNSPASPGTTSLSWTGRLDRGGRASSGRYWIRAELNGHVASRSVVLAR